jgi:hypothetical protein
MCIGEKLERNYLEPVRCRIDLRDRNSCDRGESYMTIVDGVRLVSNSEVQTFKDCPRRWWLAWHRGLKPRRRAVTGAASTGTRIHVALAALYSPHGVTSNATRALLHAQRVDQLEIDTQLSAAQFSEHGEAETPRLSEEYDKLLKAFDLEHAMLEGYVEWLAETGIDQSLEVISVEQRVEAEFCDEETAFKRAWSNPVKLIAKLDARVRNVLTGAIKFIDHKSVGSLHDPMLGLNQQMRHYHVIDDLLTEPGQPRAEGALYNMLRKIKRTRAARPPFFARIPIDHNRYELISHTAQLVGAIDRLNDATQLMNYRPELHQEVAPPRPSRDCVWKCEFFKVCRMFDDGSRVEAAIEEHYVADDPLAYYDTEETSEGSV